MLLRAELIERSARSVVRKVVCNGGAEVATVVSILDEADVVVDDHVDGSLGADGEHVDLRVLDVDHVLLAVLLGCAGLLVIIEEAVHAR
jgi:hypothetical protein